LIKSLLLDGRVEIGELDVIMGFMVSSRWNWDGNAVNTFARTYPQKVGHDHYALMVYSFSSKRTCQVLM
jgi:hypothetical protein